VARRVAVTGLGFVGSAGCGSASLAAALESGVLQSAPIDDSGGYHRPGGARRAALASNVDLSRWLPPGSARRMSTPSRFAVAAARMAVDQSGIAPATLEAAAVVMATAFGPTAFTERLLRSVFTEGPETASAFLFTECVANAPAAQVAIACGACGPNATVTQREAGALLAVGRGAAEIAEGRSTSAIVGTVDEISPLLHALLDRFDTFQLPDATGHEVPRPFDLERGGSLAADGSAVLVLEEEAQVLARGDRPMARLLAWGGAFDPTASRVGWGTGHVALGAALARFIGQAGLVASDIDSIVSGASGARSGDRLEALMLQSAWDGAPLPVVLAPKATTGEYGGGFLGAAVLLASGSVRFAATPGFRQVDPELGVVPHAGAPFQAPRLVLATSLAAGGAAAFLLLERT